MESILIVGALILGALLVFKLFGNFLKIVLLFAIAAAAVLYFTGGHFNGVNLPFLNS